MKNSFIHIVTLLLTLSIIWSCSTSKIAIEDSQIHSIRHGDLSIQINDKMWTKVNIGTAISPIQSVFHASEYITVRKEQIKDFRVTSFSSVEQVDSIGSKTLYIIKGDYISSNMHLEKILKVSCYDHFLDMMIFDVSYINHSDKSLKINKWTNHEYDMDMSPEDTVFWAFQGSSTSARADWIQPITPDYYQKNYMGMNNSDYGGGIPIVDVWRSDVGLAIGHTTMYPQLVSLPIERAYNDKAVEIY